MPARCRRVRRRKWHLDLAIGEGLERTALMPYIGPDALTRIDCRTGKAWHLGAGARAVLRERVRKQEFAHQTRCTLRSVIVAMLDDAFARLGLLDPERHLRDAIACYPRDAIVDVIASFSGKRTADTLPDGVDARYLLGIVRNLHHRHQIEPITEALIRERL
jgi:hypothetical protein